MGSLIILLIRKDRLLVRHGIGWVLVAAGFVVGGFSPNLLDFIAGQLGIAYPPTIMLLGGLCAITIKAVVTDIEISQTEIQMLRLSQDLMILRGHLKELQKSQVHDNSGESGEKT